MIRQCTNCCRLFGPEDFVKEESRNMEADRRALGLEGVRFLYYRCPACGRDDIFLDLLRRPGEADAEFAQRRRAMEEAVRRARPQGVEVVVTER
jgi:hypothetical protein